MQYIYNYVPETNHVSSVYIAAIIVQLQFVVTVIWLPMRKLVLIIIIIIITVVTLQISHGCTLCTSSGTMSSEEQIETDVKSRICTLLEMLHQQVQLD